MDANQITISTRIYSLLRGPRGTHLYLYKFSDWSHLHFLFSNQHSLFSVIHSFLSQKGSLNCSSHVIWYPVHKYKMLNTDSRFKVMFTFMPDQNSFWSKKYMGFAKAWRGRMHKWSKHFPWQSRWNSILSFINLIWSVHLQIWHWQCKNVHTNGKSNTRENWITRILKIPFLSKIQNWKP